MRRNVIGFFFGLACLLSACTYEERECTFESLSMAWVELAELKSEYQLGDTLVLLQDYIPARQNGRYITFPAEADLSWRLMFRSDRGELLAANSYYIKAEVGTINSQGGTDTYKVKPVRNGNRFRVVIKVCMKELGDYAIDLTRLDYGKEGLIAADRHQNCYEMIDLRPSFSQLSGSDYYRSQFTFSIIP